MKTPTKILVLAALAVVILILATGCIRKVDQSDSNYTEVENFSDLGVVDTGNGNATTELTGAAVAAVNEEPAKPAAGEAAETTASLSNQIKDNGKITVREGQLITLKTTGYDPDGDKITYTFSPPFDANGKWQTKAGDKGTYNVKVAASDSKTTTTQSFEVVVGEKNRAPMLEKMPKIIVVAGETVTLMPKASDPNDGDRITITYSGWMNGPTYTTSEKDIGTHDVTITASDGELNDAQTAVIDVIPKNQAPVMQKINDVTVDEGNTVVFSPNVIDPDNDKVTVAYSGWMTSPSYTTKSGDAGDYTVKITASDGKLETSQNVKVTVKKVNRPVQLSVSFEIS